MAFRGFLRRIVLTPGKLIKRAPVVFGKFRRTLSDIGRIAGSVGTGAGIIEETLMRGRKKVEKILDVAEKIPIPQVQAAASIGRSILGATKTGESVLGEVKKFSKKLEKRTERGSKARNVRELLRLAK